MELSTDWHKQTNVKLFDILSGILKPPRTPKAPKPTHAYTIAEKAPEVVTAPGVYFPAEKGEVIPLESRQEGGEVKPDLEVPDWKSKFTPEMEKEFQAWYAERVKNMGLNPNPDHPKHFYDTRGAWLAGERSTTDHLPDKYKLPGHPTFSDQSMYYKPGMKVTKPQALSSFAPTKEPNPVNTALPPAERNPYQEGNFLQRNAPASTEKEISQSHSIPLGGKLGELNLSTTDEDSDFSAKWNIPIKSRQEGGEVKPVTSLSDPSSGFRSPSEGFRGPSAGFSTAGNLTYEKNKIGEPFGPLSDTATQQYKEMGMTPPASPALSTFAPAQFKPKPRSPVMGAPPPNPEDAVMTEAERKRMEFINSPTTSLLSRQGGGPTSPDLQEGITEEERRRAEAERNKNTELGRKMWERHLKTQQENDFPQEPTPISFGKAGETPAPAPTTQTEKPAEAAPTGAISEAKPETAQKLPSGSLADYGITTETLPSGETQYTLPEGQGTMKVGKERFFAGGKEVPKGTSGAVSGDELARQRIAKESRGPDIGPGKGPGPGGSYLASYYDAHPEERLADLAEEKTKPSVEALQKSLSDYQNIAQGYGLSQNPRTARAQRDEAMKNIPAITAELARLTGITAQIPEKIFGSEERVAAAMAKGGGRAAPETQISLAKGAVEEDLKRKGIDRPATKQEILDKMLQVKKSSMSGFDSQDEAVQSAKELLAGMGSPEGFVAGAKMGTGNKWVPTAINPNIASVSMEQVKSPEFQNSLKLQAEMWLRGGGEPRFTGFGGSIAMMEFYKIAGQMAKERGMTSQEVIANQMILKGQKEATTGLIKLRENSGAFEGMVDRNITLMTNISKNLDRTQIPVLNDALRTGQIRLLSDPNAIKLYDAVQTVVTEYARMMGSMGIGAAVIQNEQRAIANKFISAGFTHEALVDVSKFLKAEMKNKLDALDASVKGSVGQIPTLPGEAPNVRPGGAKASDFGGNAPAPAPKVMSEKDARAALAAKGITGADQDNWISQYKAAGKVQ